jgi:hypothetical protein
MQTTGISELIGSLHVRLDRVDDVISVIEDGGFTPEQLLQQLKVDNVVELATHNLEAMSPDTPQAVLLSRLLRDCTGLRSRRWDMRSRETIEALQFVRAANGILIKGMALQRFYPLGLVRHRGDIDVLVEDFSDALCLMESLYSAGWKWDSHEVPWIKWAPGGELYGQWPMVWDQGDGAYLRIDIHVGVYSVGFVGRLRLEGIETEEFFGVQLKTHRPEECIALIVAHAAANHHLTMKDINDIGAISRSRIVDWSKVDLLCKQVGLSSALVQCVTFVDQLYSIRPSVAYGDDVFRTAGHISTNPPSRHQRAWANARLTSVCARMDGSLPRSLVLSGLAYLYYSSKLEPRLGNSILNIANQRWRNEWLCWRLIPEQLWTEMKVDSSVVADVRQDREIINLHGRSVRLTVDAGAMAVSAVKCLFIPTVSGAISRNSIQLAWSMMHELEPSADYDV